MLLGPILPLADSCGGVAKDIVRQLFILVSTAPVFRFRRIYPRVLFADADIQKQTSWGQLEVLLLNEAPVYN